MSSIFDFVKQSQNAPQESSIPQQSKSSYSIFKAAESLPEVVEPTRTQSIISAPIKGVLKGASEQGEFSPFVARGPVSDEMFQRLTNEILPTKDKPPERYLEKTGKVSTMLWGPGKIPSKLIRGGIASIGSQTAKELGLPDWLQSSIEIGSFLTPTTIKGAQKYVSGLYKKAESLLPEGAQANARNLRTGINNFVTKLKQGGTALSKTPAMTKAKEIISKIRSGKIDVKELTEFKKTINEARSGLYAEQGLDRKGRKAAKRNLDEVSSLIDQTLEEYGKTNPEWYEPYKAANEGFGAIASSQRASNWMARVIKQHPHQAGGAIAGTLIGHLLSPAKLAGAGVAYGGLKSVEFITRIAKSKVLRKYYKDMIKSAVNENVGGFLNNLKKISKGFESKKEQEEED